jgi:hypothetical protein
MIGREDTGRLLTNDMRVFRPSFYKAETAFNSSSFTPFVLGSHWTYPSQTSKVCELRLSYSTYSSEVIPLNTSKIEILESR